MTSASPSKDFWRGRRVLVTGHTGFKGAWLAFWLTEMGAKVYGLALPPESDLCFFNATQANAATHGTLGDIRDKSVVETVLDKTHPEVVFHLAAQALVRRAYDDPAETYSTNLSGLTNVLEACRTCAETSAIVVATSDKVYENREDGHAFVESDRLGGVEPYGISKAAGEYVIDAFRFSLGPSAPLGVATVRAGNVIGGGDWAKDRLVPDAMDAFKKGQPLDVRNPASTRPWQHVIDPLAGYILLAEKLASQDSKWRSAWNFGPLGSAEKHAWPVRDVANVLAAQWNAQGGTPVATWVDVSDPNAPYEAKTLAVDSSKAQAELGWSPRIPLDTALEMTVAWYMADNGETDMAEFARQAIHQIYPLS